MTTAARRRVAVPVRWYAATLGAALVLSAALVAATGHSWTDLFGALLEGAVLAPGRWGITLTVATPMLLVAVGMTLGVAGGVFNIGQEGQLLVGAMAMALVGTALAAPGAVVLALGLVAGAAAGGGYAAIAAVMRSRRHVPEVISTLLLVFVAFQAVGFAVTTDWLLRDPDPTRPSRAVSSAPLPADVRLPVMRVFGNDVHVGLLLALAAAAIVAFVLARTPWGFKLRLVGRNPTVAHRVGVAPARMGAMALSLSGALAGLAGAVMLAGGASGYRLTTGFSAEIGWQGLLVALLAGSHPAAAIPMALVFAGLRTGAGFLATTGVDRRIVDVIQALLVLALLLPPALRAFSRRRRTTTSRGEDVT